MTESPNLFPASSKDDKNKLEVAVAVDAAGRRKNSGTVTGATTVREEGTAGNKLMTSVKRM
ncbi:uncharacterized protein DS421_3g77840 [Arachis hypogaea]|nr:uncharacterized protein DS421_3g77840 [Arachis hypogaea]